MVVRLRLWRAGQRNLAIYRVVAADSRRQPRGKFIEIVGRWARRSASRARPKLMDATAPRGPHTHAHTRAPSPSRSYNPHPNRNSGMQRHLRLNFDRVKYWLAVGAQPSERVAKLLGEVRGRARAALWRARLTRRGGARLYVRVQAGLLPPYPLRVKLPMSRVFELKQLAESSQGSKQEPGAQGASTAASSGAANVPPAAAAATAALAALCIPESVL
jgi:small subunit ribosomal protein S16